MRDFQRHVTKERVHFTDPSLLVFVLNTRNSRRVDEPWPWTEEVEQRMWREMWALRKPRRARQSQREEL